MIIRSRNNFDVLKYNPVRNFPWLNNTPATDVFVKSQDSRQKEVLKGQIVNANGEIYTRPNSAMFRDDINWNLFRSYLQDRFKDYDRVNTVVHGCSNGSEAYTMSMLYRSHDDSEKFLPIRAFDIDAKRIKKNIEAQKKKKVAITDSELHFAKDVNHIVDDREDEFYVLKENKNNPEITSRMLTSKILGDVEFQQSNILDYVNDINFEKPTILMCRNMWPYVNYKEYEEFAQKLYNNLQPGSIVVLGNFDYTGSEGVEGSNSMPYVLKDAGFEKSNCPIGSQPAFPYLIFEKNQ